MGLAGLLGRVSAAARNAALASSRLSATPPAFDRTGFDKIKRQPPIQSVDQSSIRNRNSRDLNWPTAAHDFALFDCEPGCD